MIPIEIHQLLQYLDNYEELRFQLIENHSYHPINNLFIKPGEDGFWFGDQRITLTTEEDNILAEIPELGVHTFGKTRSQALIRCVKHAATYYEDFIEEGVYSEDDKIRRSLLKSNFLKIYRHLIGNQVCTTYISPIYMTASA
jgi:predicted RNase H-like HicB family nuclease